MPQILQVRSQRKLETVFVSNILNTIRDAVTQTVADPQCEFQIEIRLDQYSDVVRLRPSLPHLSGYSVDLQN